LLAAKALHIPVNTNTMMMKIVLLLLSASFAAASSGYVPATLFLKKFHGNHECQENPKVAKWCGRESCAFNLDFDVYGCECDGADCPSECIDPGMEPAQVDSSKIICRSVPKEAAQ
jgi:hypothetical protein